MHLSSLRALLLGLTAMAGTASAVSLASFIPRIDDLPSQCASVYNSQIQGCKPEDFAEGAQCSKACVQGLNKIAEAVKSSCADVDVGETSIVGVFQNGLGIASLCPNTPVTIITPSSSAVRTTTQVQTSTQAPAATTQTTSSTSAPATSQGQSAQSSSTSSGGIALDPNATATLATSTVNAPPIDTASSAIAANPTRAPNSQLSNADSGGGSPFDVIATGFSSQVRSIDASMVFLLATTISFFVCA